MQHNDNVRNEQEKEQNPTLVSLLPPGFDINAQDENGDTLLHLAVQYEAKFKWCYSSKGNNPHSDLTSMINAHGINPIDPDLKKMITTSLNIFGCEPRFDLIEILLTHGANPLIENNEKKIPAELINVSPEEESNLGSVFLMRRDINREKFFSLMVKYCPKGEYIIKHLERKIVRTLYSLDATLLSLDDTETLMLWCQNEIKDCLVKRKPCPEEDSWYYSDCRFTLTTLNDLSKKLKERISHLKNYPDLEMALINFLREVKKESEENKKTISHYLMLDGKIQTIFNQFLSRLDEFNLSRNLLDEIEKFAEKFEAERLVLEAYDAKISPLSEEDQIKAHAIFENLIAATDKKIVDEDFIKARDAGRLDVDRDSRLEMEARKIDFQSSSQQPKYAAVIAQLRGYQHGAADDGSMTEVLRREQRVHTIEKRKGR